MRVLCLDGGGIRGIIPALVLAELEARTGRRIAELFDLVAGTSTGGILACALTRPDPQPARELVELYREEGPRIFRRSLWRRVASVEGLVDERHDARVLRETLERYLGRIRLDEATTRLLVPTYDLVAREPVLFKSWREDGGVPMATVALATAAAPTYFEPVALGNRALVDGGVFATNPAMCAYAEARRLRPDAAVRVVSLGTGRHTRSIGLADARGWGLVEWVRPLIDVVFDGVADTVDYELRHLLGEGRYHRLQVDLDEGASDALDDASERNLEALQERARALIAAADAELDRLASVLRPPAAPPSGDG